MFDSDMFRFDTGFEDIPPPTASLSLENQKNSTALQQREMNTTITSKTRNGDDYSKTVYKRGPDPKARGGVTGKSQSTKCTVGADGKRHSVRETTIYYADGSSEVTVERIN